MNEIDNALGFNDTPKSQCMLAETTESDNKAEKVLKILANIILYGGIIATLICGFLLSNDFEPLLTILLSGILSCVSSWAFLMTLANISNNLRQIKHELKKLNHK